MTPISANVIQDAFSPLISVFKAIMVFLHNNVTGGSWGLAIIGLTIVVRAALVPLTVKQFSSMAKLQALGPDIKALQARHKDDKQRLNEEMMKFYRENQVNPFSSCLPLVLQFPVFISLFYMLRTDLKVQICGAQLTANHITTSSAIQNASCEKYAHGSGKFLFIPDITASGHGAVLVLLIVLYIGSQLVSSLLTTATVDRNQRLIALGLPFLFTIFIIGFPTGLILYWITTNLWTVGQQYVVRRYFPPANLPEGAGKVSLSLSSLFGRDEPKAATAGGKAPPGGAKPGASSKGGAATAKPKAGPGAKGPARASGAKAAASKQPTAAAKKSSGGKAAPAAGSGGKPATAKAAPASAKATPATAARRKGVAPDANANGGPGGDGKVAAAPDAKPATPRARGSAPPPPPRKKKKRSGRRR
jgi:YidC/Oxa1 family membrane protein insertase